MLRPLLTAHRLLLRDGEVLRAIGTAAAHGRAIWKMRRAALHAVLRRRGALSLDVWRRRAYQRMRAALALSLARRALDPAERLAALRLWRHRLAAARLAEQARLEAIRRAASHSLFRQLNNGFNSWCEMIAERRALAHAARRMLARGTYTA